MSRNDKYLKQTASMIQKCKSSDFGRQRNCNDDENVYLPVRIFVKFATLEWRKGCSTSSAKQRKHSCACDIFQATHLLVYVNDC